MIDRPARDRDMAARPLAPVRQAADQRGLAGPVRSDEAQELGVARGELDAVEHRQAPEMLAKLPDFDCDVAAFVGDSRAHDRTKSYRRPGRNPANATQQLLDHADKTIREGENDGDERNADDQFPDVRQAAGEVGAGDLDAQRADDRSDDRAAAAERDHDDQPRPEREACVLGCRDRAECGIAEAGKTGDDGGQYQDNDAGARGIDAEIGAARVVVAKRAQEAPGVALHDDQRHHGNGDQAQAREPKPILE